jgi:hypothetical protein
MRCIEGSLSEEARKRVREPLRKRFLHDQVLPRLDLESAPAVFSRMKDR